MCSPKTDPNPTAARRTGISKKLVDAQLCCGSSETGSSSREMRSLSVDGSPIKAAFAGKIA